MGTRHMIVAIVDKTVKIAQYGQFDGYPTGQGTTVCEFIRTKLDKEKFKSALRNITFMTAKERKAFGKKADGMDSDEFNKCYPEFHRETSAEILGLIQEGNIRKLIEYIPEPNDCWVEWTYVVDMDNETLAVYDGVIDQPKGRKPLRVYAFNKATPKAMEKLENSLDEEGTELYE